MLKKDLDGLINKFVDKVEEIFYSEEGNTDEGLRIEISIEHSENGRWFKDIVHHEDTLRVKE